MGKNRKTTLILTIVLIINFSCCQNLCAGDYNYPEVFGSNWKKAELFIDENKGWMNDLLQKNKVDYHLAMAMIFPELVRYSTIRDRMEITLLKALYKYKGTDYANFSIGIFQIKPSCAEEILREIPSLHNKKWTNNFKAINASVSEDEKRSIIIAELEDPKSQLLYVASIIKILDKRFENLKWVNDLEKLKFYAAAYNGGFSNSENYIRQQISSKTFHTGLIKSDNRYSYADIAANYFQNSRR
jgi:hypothetical protein